MAHDHPTGPDGIAAVERACAERGLRLTPIRRRVLEVLFATGRALGAYDVLDSLRVAGLGSLPLVAYRAFDVLRKHGFVHRIEHLNAFVACTHADAGHAPAFLICRSCDLVVKTGSDPAAGELGRAAREAGFRIERAVRVAQGLCRTCAEAPAA